MNAPRTLSQLDLTTGVVPITDAAGSLAMLLKRTKDKQEYIVLTQKGRTAGVLIDIGQFTTLQKLAQQHLEYLAAKADLEQNESTESTES